MHTHTYTTMCVYVWKESGVGNAACIKSLVFLCLADCHRVIFPLGILFLISLVGERGRIYFLRHFLH